MEGKNSLDVNVSSETGGPGIFQSAEIKSDLQTLGEWCRLSVASNRNYRIGVERHLHNLRQAGESAARIGAFNQWRTSTTFSEKEKAAFGWIEALSSPGHGGADSFLKAARSHLSNDEIIYLTMSITAVNDWMDCHGDIPVRVLVVENDRNDQELLLRQLRKLQMADTVLVLPDAFHALEFIEDTRGTASAWALEAMFLDIHMPGMDGIELLRRVRKMPGLEEFPVVIMSMSPHPRDLDECRKLKVANYMEKPITYASFSRVAVNLFRGQPASAPPLAS
jgi:two-component system response regulator